MEFLSQDSQNIYIRNVGKKIGDFDEQKDWRGGRGGEYFDDDPTRFFDSLNAWTASPGHVTPSLLWQFVTGLRGEDTNLPGSGKSLSWQALISGDAPYVSQSFVASSTYDADKAYIWVKREGSPGTLTLELCADSSGSPGTVLKTKTITTSNVTDRISVFQVFDWTSPESLTDGTTYHLKIYDAAGTPQNHWEIGADKSTANGKYSSNGSSWTAAAFSLYYRVTDADIDRKWLFFLNHNRDFCAVSSEANQTSVLCTIDSSAVATMIDAGTSSLSVVTGRPVTGFDGSEATTWLPQGVDANIRKWQQDYTFSDEGTYNARFLAVGEQAFGEPAMFAVNEDDNNVYGSDMGINPLSFDTGTTIGSWGGENIANMVVGSDNVLYVFKENGIWKFTVDANGNVSRTRVDVGFSTSQSPNNGVMAFAHQHFLFFSWMFSVGRYYNGIVDDIGQGWDGAGLPTGRAGVFSCGCSYMNFAFFGVDAGASGTSCVFLYDGVSWHEIFRAPAVGMRIRDVAIQAIDGAASKLWIECGGDMIYLTLPLNKARPIDDSTAIYQHEGVVVSSTIDGGAAAKLPKLIKSLTASIANLNGSGIRVEAECQTDNDVGKDGYEYWTPIGAFLQSPDDTLQINASDVKRFRYRLRLMTDNNLIPPDIRAVVPNGLARGDTRIVWSLQVKGTKVSAGGKTTDPNALLRYLVEAQENPGSVMMTSTNPLFHGYAVELALQRVRPVTDKDSSFILNLVSV